MLRKLSNRVLLILNLQGNIQILLMIIILRVQPNREEPSIPLTHKLNLKLSPLLMFKRNKNKKQQHKQILLIIPLSNRVLNLSLRSGRPNPVNFPLLIPSTNKASLRISEQPNLIITQQLKPNQFASLSNRSPPSPDKYRTNTEEPLKI